MVIAIVMIAATIVTMTLVIAVLVIGGDGDVIPSSRYWAHRWMLMLLWRPEIRR